MLRSSPAILAVAPVVLIATLAGWLDPLQNTLDDLRFRMTGSEPSGKIVLVDIDAKSILAEGRWPWPRRIHADLVDELRELGASEVAFDIDFSSRSNPEDDAAFAAALERAGGIVILAALTQNATADLGDMRLVDNRPIDVLAKHAWVASADVMPDADGKIRRLRFAEGKRGQPLPSLAAMIAGGTGAIDGDFRIDFGIRADQFDRISVIDVLEGNVDRNRIAGKRVIVGASASELRDFFSVPVYGLISGSALQAVAAETIMQGRILRPTGHLLSFVEILLVSLVVAFLFRRLKWFQLLGLIFLISVAVEIAAIAVQRAYPIAPVTAPVQTAIIVLALLTLIHEIDFRRILLLIARNQTNNAQAILDRVFADNFAGVIVADESGTIRAASRTAGKILGRANGLVGHKTSEILPPELTRSARQAIQASRLGVALEEGRRETAHTRPDGSGMILEYTVAPTRLSGGVTHDGHELPDAFLAALTFSDVTDERLAADRIAYLAEYDSITGLPNRNQIVQRLAWALQAARQTDEQSAVVCFDLDRFKNVNDTLGHDIGDLLLKAVAKRAAALIAPGDIIGRFGGDEYVVICAGGDARGRASAFAEEMIARLGEPYDLKGHRLIIGLSFGIAADEHERDPLVVLKQADTALYAAKASGGNQISFFMPGMTDDLQERRILEFELWEAVMKRAFKVFYQPQVDLASGRITGMEALLRWDSPRLGAVSPADFIPVAESLGLIHSLGAWVLETTCAVAAAWPESIKLAVNVSSAQFLHGDLAGLILRALERAGLPPHRLELEITESLFLQENEIIQVTLRRIREMGVTVALDDFGTGYSSLNYLRKFSVDKIKIDRSFVAELPGDDESMAIIRAIADLAQSLNIRLNAEGIETPQQLALLKCLGCDEGQGYLFGKAVDEQETARLAAQGSPVRKAAWVA